MLERMAGVPAAKNGQVRKKNKLERKGNEFRWLVSKSRRSWTIQVEVLPWNRVYEPGLGAEVKVSDEWKSLAGVTSGAVGPKETGGREGPGWGQRNPSFQDTGGQSRGSEE